MSHQPSVTRDELDTTWALAALAGLMPAEHGLPAVGEPEVLAWVAAADDRPELHRRVRIAARAGAVPARLAESSGLDLEEVHRLKDPDSA